MFQFTHCGNGLPVNTFKCDALFFTCENEAEKVDMLFFDSKADYVALEIVNLSLNFDIQSLLFSCRTARKASFFISLNHENKNDN